LPRALEYSDGSGEDPTGETPGGTRELPR
jgi:hypothetical protein